ncbi:MAG: protein kinase [Polyangia bacterium]
MPGSEGAHYVIGSYLTEGGMAAVYLGKRKAKGGFEKDVVLKRLRPELVHRPRLLELLLREARLAAGLEHPGIVRTLDLATLDGNYYLVMEYVRGGDLRLLLKRARRLGRRFSVQAALLIGRELLTALDYAHRYRLPEREQPSPGTSVGLIHRDISPANILVSVAGEVKLTDFGIAVAGTEALTGDRPSSSRPPEAGALHVTPPLGSESGEHEPAVASDAGPLRSPRPSPPPPLDEGRRERDELGLRARGKIGYMSPEQARGGPVDARSDLFSLAAVLYEVLTLSRLFVGPEGQSPAQVYAQPITPPSRLSELPPEGDAIFLKALAIDPAARYQSASAFYDALLGLTRRYGLWLDRAELAQHLREVCGDDPGAWSMIEERSSTAVITSIPMDDGEEPELGEIPTVPWDQSLDQGWLAYAQTEVAETPAPATGVALAAAEGPRPRSVPPPTLEVADAADAADAAIHDQPITAPWPTLPRGTLTPTPRPVPGPTLLADSEPVTAPGPTLMEDTQPLPGSLPEASEVAPVAIELTAKSERVELTSPVAKEPDRSDAVAVPVRLGADGLVLDDQATTARHRAQQAPTRVRPRLSGNLSPLRLLGLILLAMLLGALLATAQWLLTAP